MPNKPKPWEKRCPELRATWHQSFVPGVTCPCNGTGVVPMSTDEMLEALWHVSAGIHLWCVGRTWRFALDGFDFLIKESDTPTEALRAALEAVTVNEQGDTA